MTITNPRGAEIGLRDVTHLYQRQGEQVVALRDVHLHIGAGESIALLGPSGSGKSTLLSLVAGLQAPTAGRVIVDGQPLNARNPRVARRLRHDTVRLLPQDPSSTLPPFATPVQLLQLAGDPNPLDTLQRYDMTALSHQRVGSMSAGEQQRIALAVTMAGGPRLLLADEPTSRLDPVSKALVVDTLHRVTRDAETTVIAVTHDRTVAATFPRTVTMRNGRVGSDGSPTEQFGIVGPDGTLALSQEALDLLPPGSRVRLTTASPDVVLSPADDGVPQ
jgi:ABC-type lipoprotein export system ATPase subunit